MQGACWPWQGMSISWLGLVGTGQRMLWTWDHGCCWQHQAHSLLFLHEVNPGHCCLPLHSLQLAHERGGASLLLLLLLLGEACCQLFPLVSQAAEETCHCSAALATRRGHLHQQQAQPWPHNQHHSSITRCLTGCHHMVGACRGSYSECVVHGAVLALCSHLLGDCGPDTCVEGMLRESW